MWHQIKWHCNGVIVNWCMIVWCTQHMCWDCISFTECCNKLTYTFVNNQKHTVKQQSLIQSCIWLDCSVSALKQRIMLLLPLWSTSRAHLEIRHLTTVKKNLKKIIPVVLYACTVLLGLFSHGCCGKREREEAESVPWLWLALCCNNLIPVYCTFRSCWSGPGAVVVVLAYSGQGKRGTESVCYGGANHWSVLTLAKTLEAFVSIL